jgi:hypothetical protein
MSEKAEVLLDDGEFYIELNVNYPADRAPGFLQRRCPVTLTTPGGFECIGSFDKHTDGMWRADVNAVYDEEKGSDVVRVADGVSRMQAIVALWRNRHQAHCRA